MQVSPKALAEFKAIYKEQFGKDLTDQETYDKASNLLRLMDVVYRPMTKQDLEEVMKRREELGLPRRTAAATEDTSK